MFDKSQAPHTLGLEIDGSSLRGIALSLFKGGPRVDSSFVIPYPPDEGSKSLDNAQLQGISFRSFLDKHLVVTAITGQDTLVRHLDIKIKKVKDVDAVLAFQAEPLLPYPIENAMLDRIFLSQEKEGCQLSLIAVRKDHLKQHVDQWNALDIEPEVISVAPQALALFVDYVTSMTDPFYAVHIGSTTSLCVLINQKKLIAAQTIPYGIEHLIKLLSPENGATGLNSSQELANLSFSPEDLEQHPPLKDAVDLLKLAITRMVYSVAKQAKWKEINTLLITGPGALIGGLADDVALSLSKTLIKPEIPPTWNTTEEQLHFFSLPFGAALSALPKKVDQINLRTKDFAYPSPWKRLQSSIAIYALLCLGVAFAMVIFGHAYIQHREAEIKQQYLDLLNIMGKPYQQFEKQVVSKMGLSHEKEDEEVLEPALLTMPEIKQRLNFLEKEIKSTPQTYPLRPSVPLVSDVLAWLSTHANFIGTHDHNEEASTPLKIENFSYVMVKRPEPTKKQEKYQVKIELEFSSPTPMLAREFHDALIAPNEMVDSKSEIKWSSNKDRYRTSFYLKDKTQYPGL